MKKYSKQEWRKEQQTKWRDRNNTYFDKHRRMVNSFYLTRLGFCLPWGGWMSLYLCACYWKDIDFETDSCWTRRTRALAYGKSQPTEPTFCSTFLFGWYLQVFLIVVPTINAIHVIGVAMILFIYCLIGDTKLIKAKLQKEFHSKNVFIYSLRAVGERASIPARFVRSMNVKLEALHKWSYRENDHTSIDLLYGDWV